MRRGALLGLLALLLLAQPAFGGSGGFDTVERSYDLGRETLRVQETETRLHALPVRLAGEITAPVGARGRRPVVIFLHGAHQSCDLPGGLFPTQDYPCLPGFEDVPSFEGYRYVARKLARLGFVVVSLDGNPVAAADGGGLGFPDGAPFSTRTWMDLRAKIVDAHLRRLARAARGEQGDAVDFGVGLGRRLDLARVGLVGHSRGGEGAVWAALLPGPHRYTIRAVLTLAPVDFFRRLVPDLPFATVLPECDGDVFDLEGARFYDDARAEPRRTPLWQVLVRGANHNFFNRVWEDELGFFGSPLGNQPVDPCSSDQIGRTRLSRGLQERVGTAVIVPFMRAHLTRGANRRALLSPLGIDAEPPSELAGAPVAISYHAPSASRLDVIRPGARRGLRRNLLGGAQQAQHVDGYGLCLYDAGSIDGAPEIAGCGREPALQAHALTEIRVAWSRPSARIVTTIPAEHGDVRAYEAVSLRVAIDVGDTRRNPVGEPRPFSLVLRDRSGAVGVYRIGRQHPAVGYPTRPVVVLGTVRAPLSAFRGVDLSQVSAVELRFDRARRGRLLLTDLSFVR